MYNFVQYSDEQPNQALDHENNIIDFSANNSNSI